VTRLFDSLRVVFFKEFLDGIRDRRSILAAFVPIAVIPLMLFLVFSKAAEQIDRVRNITVPVVGAEYARPLVDWLDQQRGIEIEAGPAEAQVEVEAGRQGFVLVIPDDFADRFAESKTATVRILVDSSDSDARRGAERVRALLRNYGELVANQRLMMRGVSPEVTRPVRVRTVDFATDRERTAIAFGFITFVLLLAVFIGGLQIAIDSTAGERERGSLEPLLVNAVPRVALVAGKWLASVAFAWFSAVLAVAMLLIVLEYIPIHRTGLSLDLTAAEGIRMLSAVLPLGLLASALQMAVATLARSFKEAQAYVSFLMFVPMLPMMLTMGEAVERQPWKFAVPGLSQHILISGVIEGRPFAPLDFAVALSTTVLAATALLCLTAHLFGRERIVYGR